MIAHSVFRSKRKTALSVEFDVSFKAYCTKAFLCSSLKSIVKELFSIPLTLEGGVNANRSLGHDGQGCSVVENNLRLHTHYLSDKKFLPVFLYRHYEVELWYE